MIDHINWGDTLETTDFDISGTEIGTFSTDSTVGWKPDDTGLDVTQYVQDDIDNGRTATQFRLKFSNDSVEISSAAIAGFNDSEDNVGDGNVPSLEITYY